MQRSYLYNIIFVNKKQYCTLLYMKLIVGLGNPENKYNGTRHNTGFAVIDRVAGEWQDKPKFHGKVSEVNIDGEKVIFYKPSTYYNDSGVGVRSIRDFYKLDNSDILVIHDELKLPFGKVRTRPKTEDPAGNNGIKSLNEHLGNEYARLKVGIDHEDRREGDINFVLGQFNKAESEKLPEIFAITDKVIDDFIHNQFEPTSHTI